MNHKYKNLISRYCPKQSNKNFNFGKFIALSVVAIFGTNCTFNQSRFLRYPCMECDFQNEKLLESFENLVFDLSFFFFAAFSEIK